MNIEREQKLRDAIRKTQPDLTVILENIFDPLNISAVLRSCDAVGIREIFVVYTKNYLDKRGLVLGKRTSGGAFKWIDVYVFEDLEECFRRVKSRYGRILTTKIGENSPSLYSLDLSESTALLFGNEDEGISEEAYALADGNFVIPQNGFTESLNISVACAVSLFEAYRQRMEKGFYTENTKLSEAQQDLLFDRWSAILFNKKDRRAGVKIDASSEPILPVFVKRQSDMPKKFDYSNPLTKFDL